MRKLSDIEIKTYIKITQIRERFKERNTITNKDKLICVDIKKPTVITSTCFKDNKTGRRKLLKFIKEDCYL